MQQQSEQFKDFFCSATRERQGPFPFQSRFAELLPPVVSIPTGLGKTAMAVLGWLWRRRFAAESIRRATPRRLVYCLPMRVLVEQTREHAVQWLNTLDLLGGKAEFDEGGKLVHYTPSFGDPGGITVHTLMGGEDAGDWEMYPERDTILIGTQDMLLSRGLNRGYAAGRARWPMQFGLLHTDCLWVFDEIQLMGSGLATTAQLEAFRHLLPDTNNRNAGVGHGCRSVWMSATLRPEWLKTVDFKSRIDNDGRVDGQEPLSLTEQDHENEQIAQRRDASKPLAPAQSCMGDSGSLAKEILQKHRNHSLTLVVVNTVGRARELHHAIKRELSDGAAPRLILLHSRFRPPDREQRIGELLAAPPPGGTICISTQVVEAGIDVSATTLFTELAPWASLVQRFGRCNRRGEQNEHAAVRWIDLPTKDAAAGKLAAPYEPDALKASAEQLTGLSDVGLKSLPEIELPFEHTHVIRRKDLLDLFDTTPDLAGNDIDIDRFVREIEETDVRVFWRDYNGSDPNKQMSAAGVIRAEPAPHRDELCPAPIGEFKAFFKNKKDKIWRWNFTEGCWQCAEDENAIYPGQTYLIHTGAGGYGTNTGWSPKNRAAVEPPGRVGSGALSDDAYDEDGLSKTGRWQTIAQHTEDVCHEIDSIIAGLTLSDDEREALRTAARWHDWGKAHEVFQSVVPEGTPRTGELWAKAGGSWRKYRDVGRPHFRHELASALGVLLPDVPVEEKDLVAYLIAAHHGKVRLSIRSMPNETRPCDGHGKPLPQCRFARGVWDGDELPRVDLGGGVRTPAVTLSLEPMEIGLCKEEPFKGQPSWLERMLRLRDQLGPFRLAYLEALLRAADWRASAAAGAEQEQPMPAGEDIHA